MSFVHDALGVLVAAALSFAATLGPQPAGPSGNVVEPPPRQPVTARPDEPLAGVLGHDISWPNCPRGLGIPARRTLGKPLPPAPSRYVLIGLTNGPAFHPNPCLSQQVQHVRSRHLWAAAYAVVTYPTPAQLDTYGAAGPRGGGDTAGRLYNTGWAQATVNLRSMATAGLRVPVVWVDVEPVRPPAPWSSDTDANRAVLEGSIARYRRAGLRVGVYSTRYLWRSVVGGVAYGLPEWRAAGPTSRRQALRQCRDDVAIQGGDPILAQWSSVDVDYNVLCPQRPALDVLREFFAPL
ncbi:MAG: hypothetical protein WB441_00405 [Nocardioidaceae bacterium]